MLYKTFNNRRTLLYSLRIHNYLLSLPKFVDYEKAFYDIKFFWISYFQAYPIQHA